MASTKKKKSSNATRLSDKYFFKFLLFGMALFLSNLLLAWKLLHGRSFCHIDEQNNHALSPVIPLVATQQLRRQESTNSSSTLSNNHPHQQHSSDKDSIMTFGHATLFPEEDEIFLYQVPDGVESGHRWRYRSNGLYWRDTDDPLFRNFQEQLLQLRLRQTQGAIVPADVRNHQRDVATKLHQAGLRQLEGLWNKAYPYTLEHTTYPLPDGTTYLITGDIPLMWHRDSCAQVNQYLPLLEETPSPNPLEALIEGLVRRQALFILMDPYATSFRLFLDFDFQGKFKLTDWDYKSGRTIHVAMHNFELDNLAYHLKLSAQLYKFSKQHRAFDETWLRSFDKIMDTVEQEQNHNESNYVYPELPLNGKGTKVCPGDGLTWCGFRPSDDKTKYGYLIPANMMMVVSLRDAAKIARGVYSSKGEERARRAENLAKMIDDGIHKHAVVQDNEFGKIYAYEIDACGNKNMMDDANIPSLLSIPYLGYTSLNDPQNEIANNTRRFVLSPKNPYFFDGKNGNQGIGSPHTPKNYVWHLSVIMEALTTTSDSELLRLIELLQRTATNNLMHESFNPKQPKTFTRRSFAWANSLFAELVSTRIDDIIRVTQQSGKTFDY